MMKMSKEIADKIREEYFAGGVTQDKLAARHRCGQKTVSAIVRDEIWTDSVGGTPKGKTQHPDNVSVERGLCKDDSVWETLLYSPKLGLIAPHMGMVA